MQNIFPSKNQRQTEAGFTLLELLLVIGVAAVLFLGISQLTASWIDNEVADAAGQHLQRVSTVVQNYVEANWNNEQTDPSKKLMPTADALNDTSGGWDGLKTALANEGLLSNNKLYSPLSAELKIAYVTEGIGTPNAIYRATIYSPQTLGYKRVMEAARQAGNTGGIITNFPDSATAFGAFGQWRTAVNKILPDGSAPCIPTKENACLVAMISYNQQALCGPYLYRTDVESGTAVCPGGNTMTTDLEMASHDIKNAGELQADTLTAKTKATLGDTTVNGTSILNGAVSANNKMTINGDMKVSGDASYSGNVTMNGGSLNVVSLNANSVTAPKLSTDSMHAENLTLNNGNGTLAVDSNVSINGDVTMNNSGSEVLTGTVNAGEIDTNGGKIMVGTMNVQNTMNISGNVNIAVPTLSATKLVANGCLEVTSLETSSGGKDGKYGNCP